MSLGMRKELGVGYDAALVAVTDALKAEGFGVLTEIDVQATLKQKLGADFRRYKILGACNPPLAYQALQAALEIGLMLPCNVVVYEADDGHAVVVAVDPTNTIGSIDNPALIELASMVKAKLARVLAAVA